MDPTRLQEAVYNGLQGVPGAFVWVARVTADPTVYETGLEFHDEPTPEAAIRWAEKKLAEIRKDPSVKRVICGAVLSEFRRKHPIYVKLNGHDVTDGENQTTEAGQ